LPAGVPGAAGESGQCQLLSIGLRSRSGRLSPLPETAPFSPAWQGTRTTVARALRLIDGGALDHGSVEALAARLGIGPRHLDRLFQRHLAASPIQVAQTIRVQRAKRLLDTTDWPMTAIALQAGFGSLRRFNAAFAAIYRRPPSDVRRRGPADRRSA